MTRLLLMMAVAGPLLAGCGTFEPVVPDSARLSAGALGGGQDPDVTAANLAQWAFADSGRTYGRPIEAARAAASLDYLAGAIYTSPRWTNVSALTKEELLRGRQELRAALGVAPGATSQQVVDSLAGAGTALAAGDRAGAVQRLTSPVFPAGGEQTLATLGNMPYLRMANVATMHLDSELFDTSGDQRF